MRLIHKAALLWIVPIALSVASLALGRDANWDFLNYRWYNPYAFLHHRLLTDVLVAGHATFYNPLLELPFYILANHAPALVAGFGVAFAAAASFVPLYFVCRAAALNMKVAFLLALAGMLGGGVLGQIGIVSWDVPLGMIIFGALYVLGRNQAAALREPAQAQKWKLLLAGFLAGSAAGLKLTAAIYPLGLAIAILFACPPGWPQRFYRVLIFSAGTMCGVLVFGGYWMIILYHAFGNPTFPYFNELFHSPFAPPGNNRDSTFLPHDWKTALAFPFLFSANSHYVAEYDFRDIHIALAYALIPLAVLSLIFRRVPASVFTRLLLIFFIISYAVWEALFSIYRYILPLEMLAPLIIFLCVASLPLPTKIKAGLTAALLIVAQLAVSVGFTRLPWERSYIAVTVPPVPANAMVLALGAGPLGYIVPYLPQTVPVIRADSGLAEHDRFAEIIDHKISGHAGPFFALFNPGNEETAKDALAAHALHLNANACASITSNVAEPASLCPVTR